MRKFLVFLGPNLKSVTGNSEGIDNLTVEVKSLVKPFVELDFNIFDKEHQQKWSALFNRFKSRQTDLEKSTMDLIDTTF